MNLLRPKYLKYVVLGLISALVVTCCSMKNAALLYSNNYLKMNENGGITDDRYITRPEEMAEGKKEYESQNIPTLLSSAIPNVFLTPK